MNTYCYFLGKLRKNRKQIAEMKKVLFKKMQKCNVPLCVQIASLY
jgi:hypothetical protein